MDRRTLLKSLGLSVAYAGWSAADLAALLQPGGTVRAGEVLFDPTERAAITAFADAVIPATDTPGAVETGSVEFVEMVVARIWTPEQRARFRAGLAALDRRATAAGHASFDTAPEAARTRIMEVMQAEGRAAWESSGDRDASFFHTARNLVMEGYYTSEVGMKREQGFVPIPASYRGAVPLEELMRARGGSA